MNEKSNECISEDSKTDDAWFEFSGGLLLLADEWDEVGRDYELQLFGHQVSTNEENDAELLERFRQLTAAVLSWKASSSAEVVLKYYVLYAVMTERRLPWIDTVLGAGASIWTDSLRSDADRYALTLNEFWLPGSDRVCGINGVRGQEIWSPLEGWLARGRKQMPRHEGGAS